MEVTKGTALAALVSSDQNGRDWAWLRDPEDKSNECSEPRCLDEEQLVQESYKEAGVPPELPGRSDFSVQSGVTPSVAHKQ